MDKINVITLCSGYDSQCMALERIKKDFGLDYDLTAWSEIDRYACQAHDAVFPQFKGRNLGDMTAIDWSQIKDKIDLLVYSTPCQSISSAGLQHGFKEGSGTRSSIIWSTLNAIDSLKPKYLLLENVKAMVSKKFLPDFNSWLDALEERGYKNYWKVLNAKDYGVPQNRERVFVVSILGDEQYQFPEPFKLKLRLKDVLEERVDEKYYLSRKLVSYISKDGGEKNSFAGGIGIQDGEHPARSITANYWKTPRQATYVSILGNTNPSGHGMNGNVFDTEDISSTLTTNKGEDLKIKEPETIKGISVHPNSMELEFKGEGSIKEICPTIRATDYKCPNCVWEESPRILQLSRGFNKGGVMELSPSITSSSWENNNFALFKTAQDEVPCYYKGNNEDNNKILDNHEQRGIFKGDYQDFTDKILRILRKHLGEEEIQRKIRRLVSILKKEVLRQRMYEESVCNSGVKESGVQPCTPLCEEDKISDRGQSEGVRDMRFKEEYRCSSQGWELSEQFATELNDIMSFLPHEDTQEINEGLHYMRQTYGVSWVLQQTLSSLEEIWGSIDGERKESYRIRKLSEREVFRLMGVTDADIDKIQSAGISRTQQYRMAGNSIVVDVLYHIFRKMFIDKTTIQLTLF